MTLRTPPALSMRDEAKQATRQRLLEKGAELLRAQSVEALLSQVKASQVAAAAGKTTGAFYNIWDQQRDFHLDLLRHVLNPLRLRSVTAATEEMQRSIAGKTRLVDLIKRVARANMRSVRNDEYLPVVMSFRSHQDTDPSLRQLLKDYYDAIGDRFGDSFGFLLASYGRRFRPPYSSAALTVALTALVEGLSVRASIDPHAMALGTEEEEYEGSPTDSQLYEELAVILFMAMTEEIQVT